jgi:50S ribosomal protein L16 3-hydroxylase
MTSRATPKFDAPRRFLGGLSPRQFLGRHWQKAPLLVRSAIPRLQTGVTRHTLLKLAQRPGVEARLVGVRGETWSLERGPFERTQLSNLGARDWTVLVSDLEQHLPRTAALLEHLDFLPSWRVDDVMASFAVVGGSVGPHYDSYDVFLLQVHGERRWQIAEHFDRDRVRQDTPLCILEQFDAEQEWVLEPGDLLYLPPHVAHYGVAVTDAITFSLGCRAPSLKELATQFALLAIDRTPAAPWVARRPRAGQPRAGLDPALSVDVQSALRGVFDFGAEDCLRGLGGLLSQPKALFSLEADEPPSARVVRRRTSGEHALQRRSGSRWLSLPSKSGAYLYVDGQEYDVASATELAQHLALHPTLTAARVRRALRDADERALLVALASAGQLLPPSGPKHARG